MTKSIEQIQEEIKSLTAYMSEQEIANDFYYSNGRYTQDNRRLSELKREYQELLNESQGE